MNNAACVPWAAAAPGVDIAQALALPMEAPPFRLRVETAVGRWQHR